MIFAKHTRLLMPLSKRHIGDEEKIVAHLFKLYEAALNNENGKATIQKETTPKSTGIKVKVKRVNNQ